MNLITGNYNQHSKNLFNSNYNTKKNPSFSATKQELETLKRVLNSPFKSNPEAGKILNHLMNSTKKQGRHPWTKLFLETKPVKIIQKVVEVIAKHKENSVIKAANSFENKKKEIKSAEQTIRVLGIFAPDDAKEALSNLINKKHQLIKNMMPESYKGSLAASLRIMKKASPVQLGKIQFNKNAHEIIYSAFYKPKPQKPLTERFLDKLGKLFGSSKDK
ncbi:MAG TPA: hypothetical protein DDW90_06235 [Cyanobacteria bacterium UBA9971]|nr:hypothetical protein [Cyanobacteria bacterium UBA9971]